MIVGSLGDIVFQVSSEVIRTIDNLQMSGSARYGEHKRHLKGTLIEYVGYDVQSISFNIELSAYLGVKVLKEIKKIQIYEREGKTLSLVIGEKIYGQYKWVIQKHKVKAKNFDKKGNIASATIAIDLLEYLKT